MMVQMEGGPDDGKSYPGVRNGARFLLVGDWKLPIYYRTLKGQMVAVAVWAERVVR